MVPAKNRLRPQSIIMKIKKWFSLDSFHGKFLSLLMLPMKTVKAEPFINPHNDGLKSQPVFTGKFILV